MNKNRPARRSCTGQTMSESLIVLAVIGVLSAVAMPSLRGLVLDNRRTAVVNELVATLHRARFESAKRGQTVVVCGLAAANAGSDDRGCSGPDWSGGWLTAAWLDRDGDHAVEAPELVILDLHHNPLPVRVLARSFTATPAVSPPGTAVLNPFGERSSNGTLTVCDHRGSVAARAVIVAGSGRTRVASRRADGSPLNCP